MALFDGDKALLDIKRCFRIVGTHQNDSFTMYLIRIEVGDYFWNVGHRYSEFHDLNDKLIGNYGLDKSLLPPKKLFGNQTDSFVRKRQAELELYLQTVMESYLMTTGVLPPPFREFLEFNKFEVRGITQTLAESLYHYGDNILAAGSLFTMTPLQLSALTERLKLAEPTFDNEDKSKDLGHLLDFVSQLVRLHIEGSSSTIGQSNLIMNKLPFELGCFKSVKELEAYNCDMKSLRGVGSLRSSLVNLNIRNSLESIKNVLLCDVVHWPPDDNAMHSSRWLNISKLQLSHNKIQNIDISMKLLVNVENVDLSHNNIVEIRNLDTLSKLTHLNLSHNRIQMLDSLHTRLGNIRTLNLSSNKIHELNGLSKLYSLEMLDLSHNRIESLSELQNLSVLPCLETLKLIGNPVTTAVDYRIKTLALFASRVSEIVLDGEIVTQKEKDTVAVLHAITIAKNSKQKSVKTKSPKPVVHDAPICNIQESSSSDKPALLDDDDLRKSSSTSHCHETDDDDDVAGVVQFRHQVELIRKQGGDSWLRLLNTMRSIDNSELNKSDTDTNISSPSDNHAEILLPNLPVNSSEFLSYLQSIVESRERVEIVVWCVFVSTCAANWLSRIPACFAFSTSEVFVLNLVSLSVGKLPILRPFTRFDVSQIQTLSSSSHSMYVKISVLTDDAIISNYFMLTNDVQQTRNVLDRLRNLYHLTVTVDGDDDFRYQLKQEIRKKSKSTGSISDELVFKQRVGLANAKMPIKKNVYHWLGLTSSHVLLAREMFSSPTANLVAEFQQRLKLSVVVAVDCVVIKIAMPDIMELAPDSVKRTGKVQNEIPPLLFKFGYGLIVKFEGNEIIDVRFPTKESRDLFLDSFTTLRRAKS